MAAMKIFYRLCLVLFLAGAATSGFLISSLHASTEGEQAVLAPITAMFAAMAKHDVAEFKKPMLTGGTMVLMRDGKPTQMTFDAFADLIGKPGKGQIEERIHDPLVKIDNDLAVVWAPFEFPGGWQSRPLWDGFVQYGSSERAVAGCEHRGYRTEGVWSNRRSVETIGRAEWWGCYPTTL